VSLPGFTADLSLPRNGLHQAPTCCTAGSAPEGIEVLLVGRDVVAAVRQHSIADSTVTPAATRRGTVTTRGGVDRDGGGVRRGAGGCLYGNWCGPRCGGGTPKDDLDRCCKRHDECVDRRGYVSCGCHVNLITCAAPLMARVWKPRQAAGAATVVQVFSGLIATGGCLRP
jgi:hypothetical protein